MYGCPRPHCKNCRKEMQQEGGQLLGPPDSMGRVKVHRICRGCYDYLTREFSRTKAAAANGNRERTGAERLAARAA